MSSFEAVRREVVKLREDLADISLLIREQASGVGSIGNRIDEIFTDIKALDRDETTISQQEFSDIAEALDSLQGIVKVLKRKGGRTERRGGQ